MPQCCCSMPTGFYCLVLIARLLLLFGDLNRGKNPTTLSYPRRCLQQTNNNILSKHCLFLFKPEPEIRGLYTFDHMFRKVPTLQLMACIVCCVALYGTQMPQDDPAQRQDRVQKSGSGDTREKTLEAIIHRRTLYAVGSAASWLRLTRLTTFSIYTIHCQPALLLVPYPAAFPFSHTYLEWAVLKDQRIADTSLDSVYHFCQFSVFPVR